MNSNYQSKIVFKFNEPFDVNYVNNVCRQHTNGKVLVEIQNTFGINSQLLERLDSNVSIRIAGAYDDTRLNIYINQTFGNEDCKTYYYDSVIYTRNEAIKIVQEMEKVEKGINENWSKIQKVIYIYNSLKCGIMYDPKYKSRKSKDVRSLRGLITKQTVCAGYALIFKEMLDRQGIRCDYVRGGGHAWNIVTIDGKMYPIDLTWDNTLFRSGSSNTFDFLGQDIDTFNKNHTPAKEEPLYGYQSKLSQINSDFIKNLFFRMDHTRNYQSTTYHAIRNDKSEFIVAQIGDASFKGKKYYRYYYADILEDGRKSAPLILYSDTNITCLVDFKRFQKAIPPNYENAVVEMLFSKENIADSISKKTYYIGNVKKHSNSNKQQFVSSVQEIDKPSEKRDLFVYPTRVCRRSDKSVLIIQQMRDKPIDINGVKVMHYDILEMVNENGEEVLKRNRVYTEKNIFNDTRQEMIDNYLSRESLNRRCLDNGGYIGNYDKNGKIVYNSELVSYFESSRRIQFDDFYKKSDVLLGEIPPFEELKSLASKYGMIIDMDDPNDISKVEIQDINTGKTLTDKSLIDKAIFANIWLSAAGVKHCYDEKRNGYLYAFNEEAEELYNLICRELTASSKNNGVIDTVDLFKNIDNMNDYKYNREIIVNLFRTPTQAGLINKLFLDSVGKNYHGHDPEALYSISYAGNLAYNSSKGKNY